jgi:hypothetical protein
VHKYEGGIVDNATPSIRQLLASDGREAEFVDRRRSPGSAWLRAAILSSLVDEHIGGSGVLKRSVCPGVTVARAVRGACLLGKAVSLAYSSLAAVRHDVLQLWYG